MNFPHYMQSEVSLLLSQEAVISSYLESDEYSTAGHSLKHSYCEHIRNVTQNSAQCAYVSRTLQNVHECDTVTL